MFHATCTGRLTKDPEAISDKCVVLTLAVDCGPVSRDAPDGERKTLWVGIRVVGTTGSGRAQGLRKGDLVITAGDGDYYEFTPDGAARSTQRLQLVCSSVGLVSRPAPKEPT